MAEGYQDNKKPDTKDTHEKFSVTISGVPRASTRERYITERLELDPSKQSYDTKKSITVEHKPTDVEENSETEVEERGKI